MSRTIKGSKPAGFESWSRRPFNNGGGSTGRFHKKRTLKAERQMGKKEIREQELHNEH